MSNVYAWQGLLSNVQPGYADGIGGLAGFNSGTIRHSYGTGVDSHGLADYVGGLVGVNTGGTIRNAYSIGGFLGGGKQGRIGGLVGAGIGGTLRHSYSAAARLAGGDNLPDGLVGELFPADPITITSSFWDNSVSPRATDHAHSGKTGVEMRQFATYSGWNIAAAGGSRAVWRIYEGFGYPWLRSFLTPLTLTAEASKTYDGQAFSGGAYVGSAVYDPVHVLGKAAYGDDAQGAVNAGSYPLTLAGLYSDQRGYDLTLAHGRLTVNPYVLNLSGSRTYDGTMTLHADIFNLGTLVGVETLLLSGNGSMADPHVGTGKPVTLDTLALADGSGLAANYTLAGGTHRLDITPAFLLITSPIVTKTYDGTATVTGTTVFADKNTGSDKTVTISNNALNAVGATVTRLTGSTLVSP